MTEKDRALEVWRLQETVTLEGAQVTHNAGTCYSHRSSKLRMLNLKSVIFIAW